MPPIIPELCIGLSLFVKMPYPANLDQEPHQERRPRRKQPSARLPDPRYATSRVDNHFFDDTLPDEELDAANRLIELAERCEIVLVIPHTVKRELDHPNTPNSVRMKSSRLVYTMDTGMGNKLGCQKCKRSCAVTRSQENTTRTQPIYTMPHYGRRHILSASINVFWPSRMKF